MSTIDTRASQNHALQRKVEKHRVEYALGKGPVRVRLKPMRNEDFRTLCEIVKKASFDEQKLDILTVACMGCYFSSKQCEKLLSLFSFEDDKLDALNTICPRLLEQKELAGILKQFKFSTSKDKAIEILTHSDKREK